MQEKKVLIIGLVWPEPNSSAAGTRMVQLLQLFRYIEYEVVFASAAQKSEFSADLENMGVLEEVVKLNDNSFNDFVRNIQPEMVVYDRYMIEEQFGWRVRQECPEALTILDTEDLHCLRAARQQAVKAGNLEKADLYNDTAKREIAAILRSDLSLIISEVELDLLVTQYGVDKSLLYYLPFLEQPISPELQQGWQSFEAREGFVFIGNYLHEPNWHTLQVLKSVVWPKLRKLLPSAKMHIYGAYSSQKVMQLHNAPERFLVHGRANNAAEAMSSHRILLAPIKFGAGLKGKFIDAMKTGTPAATTSIGAEAMAANLPWNGIIADDMSKFCALAAQLYNDKERWMQVRENGAKIINDRYARTLFEPKFLDAIRSLKHNLEQHRSKNFVGQVLQHHTLNSLKYMSLWISEKNKR